MDENLVNRLRSLAGIIPQKHTLPSGADTVICSLEAFLQIKELAKEAADALEELSKPRWIPVTEPPKEDGWYQVYAPGYSGGSSSGLKNIRGNMYSAFKNGKWSIEVGYHKRPGCVKAWMPLPEPPKEEA